MYTLLQTLMDNMGDVTYDNPVYELEAHEMDDPVNRLVQFPSGVLPSSSHVSYHCGSCNSVFHYRSKLVAN